MVLLVKNLQLLRSKWIYSFIFFPLSQIIMMIAMIKVLYVTRDKSFLWFIVAGVIISILADALLLRAFQKIIQNSEDEKRLTILQAEQKKSDAYSMQMQLMCEKDRKFKHGIHHHLAVLKELYAQHNYKEFEKLLFQISLDMAQLDSQRFCNNAIVNVILSSKKSFAESAGVFIDFDISMPTQISMELVDICSLLSNMLDNAIEACQRLTDKVIEKRIAISITVKNGILIFKVINPYSGLIKQSTSGLFLTTKKNDPENHGIGTLVIEDIVKKYDGKLYLSNKDKIFEATAMLPLTV